MEILLVVLLGVAALIHLLPLVGASSVSRVESLYGVQVDGPDLAILLRHRAVLFGLLGALLVLAAVDADLRTVAIVVTAVSDLAFAALTLVHRGHNTAMRRVLVADVVSLAALAAAAIVHAVG